MKIGLLPNELMQEKSGTSPIFLATTLKSNQVINSQGLCVGNIRSLSELQALSGQYCKCRISIIPSSQVKKPFRCKWVFTIKTCLNFSKALIAI